MNIAAQSVVARLPLDAQARLVEQVRAVCKASPLVTPVATNGEPMSVRVTSAGPLGWVGDGRYHYSPVDSRGKPWPPIPTEWIDLANRLAGERSWDCALINWYEPGAKLGLHRDVGERDRSHPILTISIGDAASWAVLTWLRGLPASQRLDAVSLRATAEPGKVAPQANPGVPGK